jgi:predicted HAD superfamily Cof-like phosphohydrolase
VSAHDNYASDVGAFHQRFNLPVTGTGPAALLDEDTFKYRLAFLQEELREFIEAHERGDLAETLDALVDLAWVAIGTAHYMRAPFDDAWREVVKANMSKVLASVGDPTHKRGSIEIIRKPPGWRPPDVAGAIARHENLRQAEMRKKP